MFCISIQIHKLGFHHVKNLKLKPSKICNYIETDKLFILA